MLGDSWSYWNCILAITLFRCRFLPTAVRFNSNDSLIFWAFAMLLWSVSTDAEAPVQSLLMLSVREEVLFWVTCCHWEPLADRYRGGQEPLGSGLPMPLGGMQRNTGLCFFHYEWMGPPTSTLVVEWMLWWPGALLLPLLLASQTAHRGPSCGMGSTHFLKLKYM